jgi:hypothetical protein
MKTYEVEYRRTSYITMTVEANSKEEADQKAWREIEHDRADINDACWELELIQEVEDEAG